MGLSYKEVRAGLSEEVTFELMLALACDDLGKEGVPLCTASAKVLRLEQALCVPS